MLTLNGMFYEIFQSRLQLPNRNWKNFLKLYDKKSKKFQALGNATMKSWELVNKVTKYYLLSSSQEYKKQNSLQTK